MASEYFKESCLDSVLLGKVWLCPESFPSLLQVSCRRWSLGYDGQMWDCKSALSNKHSLFDALDSKPLFVVFSLHIFFPLPPCQVES